MSKSKILVTGGAGFIGSNFIHHVLGQNSGVEILCIDKLGYAGNLENLSSLLDRSDFHFQKVDITDEAALAAVFEAFKPQVVIHFAAESHVDRSIQSSTPFILTNVLGTQILLDVSRRQSIERFVHVSTDEVYGDIAHTQAPSVETDPILARNPYSASKAASDLLVLSYVHTFGFPAVITRCSNNYGPYQFPEKFISLCISNALEDKSLPIYGDGLQVRDWIYVTDHAEAIWQLAQKGKLGEIYNIGGHNQPTNIDIARRILKILGKPESLLTYVTDRLGHDRRYNLDDSKLIKQTGFSERVSLDEGLAKTVAWYKHNEAWWRHIKSGEYRAYYEKQYAR